MESSLNVILLTQSSAQSLFNNVNTHKSGFPVRFNLFLRYVTEK